MVVVDGPELRRRRLGRGLTQAALGEAAGGLHKLTIGRMERGTDGGCRPGTLDLVADALRCDPNDLILDENPHTVVCPACGTSVPTSTVPP